jgi:plasmid stabilization system protein ParE
MRVSFNPDALAEAEDAVRWYRANGGAGPAQEYAQELRRVVKLAAVQPGIASLGPHGTSRLYFKRFPYTLIFRIRGEALRVLAIAHQSRRPGYWFGRR